MPSSQSKTKILNPTPANIETVVQALQLGDVIGLPTETVYGLAGNALNDEAIAKIFLFKSRPSFDPLIVHVPHRLNSCQKLAQAEIIHIRSMTPAQILVCDALMKHFWPGPMTLILPKNSKISDLVTSSLPTVGIRSPAHPVAQEVLQKSQLPLAAPSANKFGRISPTKAEHVLSELGETLNFCLEGGECSVGLESTIVTVDKLGQVTVLRPGGISNEVLAKFLGASFKGLHTELGIPAVASHAPISPGLLESHYAPKKTMFRISGDFKEAIAGELKNRLLRDSVNTEHVSILSTYILNSETQFKLSQAFPLITFHYLAESVNDSLAGAHHLFSKLRELDENQSTLILCELPVSKQGLWPAIRDRLTRASRPLI